MAEQRRRAELAEDVRTAADADSTLDQLQRQMPDVVLLSLASTDALAVLAVTRELVPGVKVVALAVSETDDEMLACAEAGVSGLLPRDGIIRH